MLATAQVRGQAQGGASLEGASSWQAGLQGGCMLHRGKLASGLTWGSFFTWNWSRSSCCDSCTCPASGTNKKGDGAGQMVVQGQHERHRNASMRRTVQRQDTAWARSSARGAEGQAGQGMGEGACQRGTRHPGCTVCTHESKLVPLSEVGSKDPEHRGHLRLGREQHELRDSKRGRQRARSTIL